MTGETRDLLLVLYAMLGVGMGGFSLAAGVFTGHERFGFIGLVWIVLGVISAVMTAVTTP